MPDFQEVSGVSDALDIRGSCSRSTIVVSLTTPASMRKIPAPTRTAACHSRRLLAEDALYFRRESPDEITGIDAIFGSGWKQRCPQSIWKHLDPRHPFNPGMRGIPHGLCRWVESAERHTFSPPFKEVLTLEPVHLLQATRIGEYAG